MIAIGIDIKRAHMRLCLPELRRWFAQLSDKEKQHGDTLKWYPFAAGYSARLKTMLLYYLECEFYDRFV